LNKRKMLKWAAFLDQVPRKNFDMSNWGVGDAPVFDQPTCATRACALGWATAIPEFNRAGLYLRANFGSYGGCVYYRGVSGDDAAREFFGLTVSQAERLCYTGSDDPKAKARQIRRMVARAVNK
jgi:hypothetical protein